MALVEAKKRKIQPFEVEPEKFIDKVAEKVVELLGKNPPIGRIRSSQLLSALIGAIGFSLFIDGIGKLFVNFSGWTLLILGFVLMVVTGLLIQNLNR